MTGLDENTSSQGIAESSFAMAEDCRQGCCRRELRLL